MAKKSKHYRLRGAGTATSRSQERDLLTQAAKVRDDPMVVLPDLHGCGKNCFLCPVVKLERKLLEVQQVADDAPALARLANRGEPLAMAYAGTLGLLHGRTDEEGNPTGAPTIPRVAQLRTPYGPARFALRGKGPHAMLAGIQNSDDVGLKLAAHLELVQGKGLHLYATPSTIHCSGKADQPPEAFRTFLLRQFKADLVHRGDRQLSSDLDGTALEQDPMVITPWLRVRWEQARLDLTISERAAKRSESLLGTILRHVAIPPKTARAHLQITSGGGLRCNNKCATCYVRDEQVQEETAEGYLTGRLSDEQLITRQVAQLQGRLPELETRVFVRGRDCYGDNAEAFLDSLEPTDEERIATAAVLEVVEEPLILKGDRIGGQLAEWWPEHGSRMLRAILQDERLADELSASMRMQQQTPAQVLQQALVIARERDVISQLPTYERLPPVAAFADLLARTHRTAGAKATLRLIERSRERDTKARSVAFAALQLLGGQDAKRWQFSAVETEFAEYLSGPLEHLLDAEPEQYDEALQAVLAATGSTERITQRTPSKRGPDRRITR